MLGTIPIRIRSLSLRMMPIALVGMLQQLVLPAQEVSVRPDIRSKALVNQLNLVQPQVVKIYGAGRGQVLESYQSGVIVSADGDILTAWSTVLDIEGIRVVTSDGRRYEGRLVGMEPATELALIKVDVDGLPHFDLDPKVSVDIGDRVFAVSNLFAIAVGNEPASVQRGTVLSVGSLQSEQDRLKTPYRGEVIFHDCMTNNPGAKGGALINLRGQLVGLLGKELRDERFGIWINYAIPASVLHGAVQRMRSGQKLEIASTTVAKNPVSPEKLGIVLLPDVLPRTPAYVDRVLRDSLAAQAGLQPNDLILFIQSIRIGSQRDVEQAFSQIEYGDRLEMVVQRGTELITVEIRP